MPKPNTYIQLLNAQKRIQQTILYAQAKQCFRIDL